MIWTVRVREAPALRTTFATTGWLCMSIPGAPADDVDADDVFRRNLLQDLIEGGRLRGRPLPVDQHIAAGAAKAAQAGVAAIEAEAGQLGDHLCRVRRAERSEEARRVADDARSRRGEGRGLGLDRGCGAGGAGASDGLAAMPRQEEAGRAHNKGSHRPLQNALSRASKSPTRTPKATQNLANEQFIRQ